MGRACPIRQSASVTHSEACNRDARTRSARCLVDRVLLAFKKAGQAARTAIKALVDSSGLNSPDRATPSLILIAGVMALWPQVVSSQQIATVKWCENKIGNTWSGGCDRYFADKYSGGEALIAENMAAWQAQHPSTPASWTGSMTCPLSYQYCNRRFHYFSNPPGVWVENNYAVANLFPICVGLTTRQPYTTEDGTPYCSLTGCPVGESCKEKNSCQATPHPIVMGTGNKYLIESDVSTAGMVFNRTYNTSNTVPDVSAFQEGSRTLAPSKNGKGWSVSYRSQIKRGNAGSATVGWALRADGRLYTYRFVGAAWVGDADVPDRLTELKDGSGKRTRKLHYCRFAKP